VGNLQITYQFLCALAGTFVIRTLHIVRRRVVGVDRYFTFSDFLIDERNVHSRGFFEMTLPAVTAGVILGLVPGTQPATAIAAGLGAAFLDVWPVFRFRYHLLERYLLERWDKLKLLYVLFVALSAGLTYVGFVAGHWLVALVRPLTGTTAWQKLRDDIAANALYDVLKFAVIWLSTAVLGLYLTRERKRIGESVDKEKKGEVRHSDRNSHR